MNVTVTIEVQGYPLGTTDFYGYGTRKRHTYRTTHVKGTFTFENGIWKDVQWSGEGTFLKKDETFGSQMSNVPPDFQPDHKTLIAFMDKAFGMLKQAGQQTTELKLVK